MYSLVWPRQGITGPPCHYHPKAIWSQSGLEAGCQFLYKGLSRGAWPSAMKKTTRKKICHWCFFKIINNSIIIMANAWQSCQLVLPPTIDTDRQAFHFVEYAKFYCSVHNITPKWKWKMEQDMEGNQIISTVSVSNYTIWQPWYLRKYGTNTYNTGSA